MRGSAFHLFGLAIVCLALVGCKSWGGGKKTAANDPYDQPIDPPITDSTYGAPPPSGGYDNYSTSGQRTHVVQKKETLFSIARMYYNGDASKWKVIYEANRDQIANKDQIRVGQKLIIP